MKIAKNQKIIVLLAMASIAVGAARHLRFPPSPKTRLLKRALKT